MEVHTAFWAIVVLAIIPMPLLLVTWLGCLSRSSPLNRLKILVLIAATISYFWLVVAMLNSKFLAESYSTARFAIIDGNFLVMVGCSIAAFRGTDRWRVAFGFACVLTALVWSVIGAINTVV